MEPFLLACQSRAQVDDAFERAFDALLHARNIGDPPKDKAQEELREVVVAALTPDASSTFHDTLRTVVSNTQLHQLVLEIVNPDRRQLWRHISTSTDCFPSLPRLLDLNWYVEVPVASDAAIKHRDPCACVEISIQATSSFTTTFPPLQHITFQADRGSTILSRAAAPLILAQSTSSVC
ncbi:hypothetical protein AaE_011144 [Aphanomyces astaci]|uniref:COMM domain-containing protein n=1 Tax=Aphanomyces astaci TaxID=112090 RepID=A0A6A4ZUN2_APHAT|nr:hypothetical protein AaE_011144 [Aphanomyces astaci]